MNDEKLIGTIVILIYAAIIAAVGHAVSCFI